MHRIILGLIPVLFIAPGATFADDELEKLIEALTQVAEPGVGYSAYFSGSTFLPYSDSEQLGTLVLGGTHRSQSEILRELVAKGPDAVPTLIKHLSDDRKIAIEPLKGMMWIDFSDEYDFNRRTRQVPPLNVNRDRFGDEENHPDSHAITVGDLCFVAIGQIVNRNYSATRYQPTGGLVVSSPTYSHQLRKTIIADWSNLTAAKHRQLLIEDFEKPDHEFRRIGAYLRLSFYYPDAVEQLVLKLLDQPSFDVMKVHEFVRNTLYRAKAEGRKSLYDRFIRENGSHYSAAVMDYLFDDLRWLELDEERGNNAQATEFGSRPRELLIQLFDKPSSIKSTDRPYRTLMSESERAQFIAHLTHDESERIGEVVKQIYLRHAADVYVASKCLMCLANRSGQAEFLVDQLNGIDLASSEANELQSHNLEAIATSKFPLVRERLLHIARTTNNETYFMHALSGLSEAPDEVVWENATRILNSLPKDSELGRGILQLIASKFPDKAEEVFESFLAAGSQQRAKTMCDVLWYGHPLSLKILAPLLDDKRELSGFSIPTRVCDRAAQAISHTSDDIKFDTDWPQRTRDEVIVKLKKYCESRR